MYLPNPPSNMEKYSFFGKQKRWAFVWLFAAQLTAIYAFVEVALHGYDTLFLLVFLLLLLPPTVVNFWLRMRSHRGTLDEHLALVADWRAKDVRPSVDVFLPVCGESPSVLHNTWEAVRGLEYAGAVNVWVLDDAALPWVGELAERFGFHYVVRPNRGELKKAGNLIHALGITRSDFILVLDADFAPRADFLDETLPYFDDQRIGVVQTSQYFDTDGGVPFMARCAGVLQNLFFHWTQPARDTYEAAICAGTNVVYRRAAVLDAGGFARVPIGEDVHSGVKLWAAGWHTRFVRLNLAKGLAPDTIDAIVNQQVRWCRSSMLLMINRNFTVAPFSRRQRICFWAAFIYYMSSAAVLLTLPAPTFIMLWKYPTQINAWWYLPVLLGVVSTLYVFPKISPGWSPLMFRLTVLYSVCHLLAITHAIRGVVQAWVPTGVTQKKANMPRQVRFILRSWVVLIQIGVWGGLLHAVHQGVSLVALSPALALAGWQLLVLGTYLVPHRAPDAAEGLDRELAMFDLAVEREAA